MIPGLVEFGIAIAAHLTTDAAKAAVKASFAKLAESNTDLNTRVIAAQSAHDNASLEALFKEAVGVLIAEADHGKITVDGATLTALRGIKFDHQHGTVEIGNAKVSAAVLATGGGVAATGKTTVGSNTILQSQGTAIHIGQGAAIVMTGGAKIVQN